MELNEILKMKIDERQKPFSDNLIIYQALRDMNISYTDFGVEDNFIAAENVKNEICDKIISLNNKIINMINLDYDNEELNKIVMNFSIGKIHSELNEAIENIKHIIEDRHVPTFQNQRKELIFKIKKILDSNSGKFFLTDRDIKLHDFFYIYSSKLINENGDNYLIKSKEYHDELQKIYNDARKKQEEVLIDANKIDFAKLTHKHTNQSWWWFGASIFITIICVIFIVCAFNIEINHYNYANTIKAYGLTNENFSYLMYMLPTLFKKILLVSLPFIFLKITLNKYNIERNLRIIYENRIAVLNKYLDFEKTIDSRPEQNAINEFRIEVMKYIFSDPLTGYIKDSKQNDLNINPIMNIVDKLK